MLHQKKVFMPHRQGHKYVIENLFICNGSVLLNAPTRYLLENEHTFNTSWVEKKKKSLMHFQFQEWVIYSARVGSVNMHWLNKISLLNYIF